MKSRLLLLLFCMILLIGSVNAINWDNGISYKDNDMIVEFENGYFFGLGEWLGFSEKLGEAELTSHKTITEVRNVMSGVNRTTMYYDFNDWEIYPDGLGDVFFTDMRTGKEVKKDYYFAKAIYKDQERIVYNQECSQRLSGNGTQENYDCKKILVINETEKIIVGWERLLTNDIPGGKEPPCNSKVTLPADSGSVAFTVIPAIVNLLDPKDPADVV